MTATASPVRDRSASRSLKVLQLFYGSDFARDFSVRLWDGTFVPAREHQRFVFVVNARYALRAAFRRPMDLNPGVAFVNRLIDIEGSVDEAIDAMIRAEAQLTPLRMARFFLALSRLPQPPASGANGVAHLTGAMHSRKRDAAAIGFHYDQPIEFYRSFLDSQLVYSCAYYDEGIETLEDAQRAKLDYLLRKLRVAPGERLLDIGCGFGALVIRAAQQGAQALGITLSRNQYDEAQRRIASLDLGGRARVELCDYRNLQNQAFDKIVSVGMVEHVGRERMAEYFKAAFTALRPGGLFLNHGIADHSPKRRGYRTGGFIGAYVFPDGDLIPVSDTLLFAERAGFEIRDVESLREHYARTLRAWVANLERNAAAAIAATSDRTQRVWRLYMSGSAQGFATGRYSIFQALLAKPGAKGRAEVPATRRWMYT
jgi:cyclopropane-fatty-acyl-phospholipid synthase